MWNDMPCACVDAMSKFKFDKRMSSIVCVRFMCWSFSISKQWIVYGLLILHVCTSLMSQQMTASLVNWRIEFWNSLYYHSFSFSTKNGRPNSHAVWIKPQFIVAGCCFPYMLSGIWCTVYRRVKMSCGQHVDSKFKCFFLIYLILERKTFFIFIFISG